MILDLGRATRSQKRPEFWSSLSTNRRCQQYQKMLRNPTETLAFAAFPDTEKSKKPAISGTSVVWDPLNLCRDWVSTSLMPLCFLCTFPQFRVILVSQSLNHFLTSMNFNLSKLYPINEPMNQWTNLNQHQLTSINSYCPYELVGQYPPLKIHG